MSAEAKATLKKFLTGDKAGKLWEIDVPAFVGDEPAVPHNYWVRGILGELAIYKREYKAFGYIHEPGAPGFDFTGPKWVQVKTVSNPSGAISRMKTAVNSLIQISPVNKPLRLHILTKPETGSVELEAELSAFIRGTTASDRFELLITEFELIP